MRRTKEEAELTRQTIIDAGLILFSEQGVSQTCLMQIAKRAKVSRGAVYWHFKNKWEIFDALFSRYSGRIEELAGAGQEESESDPLGRLSELLHFMLINVATRDDFRNIFKIFLHERFMRENKDVPQRISEVIEQSLEDKRNTLENAKRKGQLPKDLDTRAGARMIHTMIEGIVHSALQAPDIYDLEKQADRYVETVLVVLRYGLRELGSE